MQLRKTLVVRSAWTLLIMGSLVYAVTIRGARAKHLPIAVPPFLNLQPTSLSPKETAEGRIAFAQGREIFLMNADGTGLTQLTHSGPGVSNYQPAISPDGTRVVYGRIQGAVSGISVVDVNGGGLRSLTTNQTSYDSEPAWSPDGTMIAFVRGYDPTAEGFANFSECEIAEVYLLEVDSVAGLTINLTPGKNSTDPSWSPDGQRIAFASNRSGNFEIYATTIDGNSIEQLTDTEANEADPVWSPDGRQIAYARDYERVDRICGWEHTPGRPDPLPLSSPDIYLMSTDGTNQRRLTETRNNIEPTWSPDGTSLAFIRFGEGASQLFVRAIGQESEFNITSDSGYKLSPSWSRADPRLPIDGE